MIPPSSLRRRDSRASPPTGIDLTIYLSGISRCWNLDPEELGDLDDLRKIVGTTPRMPWRLGQETFLMRGLDRVRPDPQQPSEFRQGDVSRPARERSSGVYYPVGRQAGGSVSPNEGFHCAHLIDAHLVEMPDATRSGSGVYISSRRSWRPVRGHPRAHISMIVIETSSAILPVRVIRTNTTILILKSW